MIMIKVHERGTDLKKNYRDDVKIATKKLRIFLCGSAILNVISIIYVIYKFNN